MNPKTTLIPTLLLCLFTIATAQNPTNLFTNGDFSNGLREWDTVSWKQTGKHKIDKKETYDGKPTLRMESRDPDHTMANQIITVKPNTRYRITAMVKAEDIEFHEKGKNGACLGIRGTFEKSDPLPPTFDWQEVVFEFDSKDRTEVEVGPHLGWHASTVTGKVWFASIRMVEL